MRGNPTAETAVNSNDAVNCTRANPPDAEPLPRIVEWIDGIDRAELALARHS